MKWRKLGCIYEPAAIGEWAASHAAVPFAVRVDEHRWRVFYSARDTRQRTHVAFFELDLRQPQKILRICERPVLAPGALGTYDEDGAMGSWIVPHQSQLLLYTTGWNRGLSVPFRNAIGLATGDGDAFTRISDGPILDRGIHDPGFVANPCVLVEAGRWRMWYLSCVRWEVRGGTPVHRYHIKYAESRDGLEWRRDGTVCIDFADDAEVALARPCVVVDGDVYRMWYSRRGDRYRMGYAESRDGVTWTRMDDRAGLDVSPSGWDSDMVGYAHVFDAEGARYMLYNGNGYGATGIGLAVLEAD